MKLLTCLISLMLFIGCASSAPWSKTDKILWGTAISLKTVDYMQTKKLVKDPLHHEKNPILGENPSQNTIDLYFATTAIGLTIIAHKLPPKWRKGWLVAASVISGICIARNFSIGINF